MTKKQASLILLFGDLFCLWLLWFGYSEMQTTLSEIASQKDIIRFSSRAGFYIMGFILPLSHPIMIIEHFRPRLIKKYYHFLNQSAIVLLIILFAAGFAGSSWLKSQAKNAGYVYCRNASGVSALAKTLVYTKDIKSCEDLVASKRKGLR
ncbi:MAG: hypothetical protein PVJ19_18070 [Desulfobacteraceae bacterium]|jgi:hypothetical protein